MIVNVYIPVSNDKLGISGGSAIVGVPVEEAQVLAYLEGNLYKAVNLHKYKERVQIAALRLRDNCPTVAKEIILTSELIIVGNYDTESNELSIRLPDLLSQWESLYRRKNMGLLRA